MDVSKVSNTLQRSHLLMISLMIVTFNVKGSCGLISRKVVFSAGVGDHCEYFAKNSSYFGNDVTCSIEVGCGLFFLGIRLASFISRASEIIVNI